MINSAADGLSRHWNFTPTRVSRRQRCTLLGRLVVAAHRRPDWMTLKPVSRRRQWIVYFMFAPDGVMSPVHRFTLARLRDHGLPLLVVCASRKRAVVPPELASGCDALLWKATPGYDFSAYSLALHEISRHSPGADVIVLNDSVFGPFTDLRAVLDDSPWDLTGFTASSEITNHIQSYAFCLRGVDRATMRRLSSVFFPGVALSQARDVIDLQETRMARVAARSMKVGALWYSDARKVHNPTLVRPIALLDEGFPFLKRALLTKSSAYIERDVVLARLERYGHPLDI